MRKIIELNEFESFLLNYNSHVLVELPKRVIKEINGLHSHENECKKLALGLIQSTLNKLYKFENIQQNILNGRSINIMDIPQISKMLEKGKETTSLLVQYETFNLIKKKYSTKEAVET